MLLLKFSVLRFGMFVFFGKEIDFFVLYVFV